jgi:galactose oxidase-like protein
VLAVWCAHLALIIGCAARHRGAGLEQELGVRNGHGAASDGSGILMFGGADESQVLAETWILRSGSWRRLPTSGPPPRTFPSMAWDAARGEVLLFGGSRVLFGPETLSSERLLADTWVWSGESWRSCETGVSPAARAEAAAAYDEQRRRVVMFGGYTIRGTVRERLGDTWEWNGERWEQAASDGPSPRNNAAMAYDAGLKRIVLFGGSGATADTWAWEGSAWRRISTNEVPGRYNSAMAFDYERGVIVRFGGWDRTTRASDTWLLEADRWRLVESGGPPARNHATLTWHPGLRRVVLFGGHDGESVMGDVWSWDGSRWHIERRVPARKRVDNGH